jgi:hypothetical protein
MIPFILQHQFGLAAAIYWIFSAAVSAMPDPKPVDPGGYVWVYRFVHTIAGNLTTVFGNRLPLSKLLPLVLIVPLLIAGSACAAHYAVHPGSLNAADSAAYDTLFIAETVIDLARQENISSKDQDALKTLVALYNAARESWLIYRGALATNAPSDQYFQELTKNLTELTDAIRHLKEVKQ